MWKLKQSCFGLYQKERLVVPILNTCTKYYRLPHLSSFLRGLHECKGEPTFWWLESKNKRRVVNFVNFWVMFVMLNFIYSLSSSYECHGSSMVSCWEIYPWCWSRTRQERNRARRSGIQITAKVWEYGIGWSCLSRIYWIGMSPLIILLYGAQSFHH